MSEERDSSPEAADQKVPKQSPCPLRFDAQEFYGFSEDELVDFDTAEEFLLHFSRIGHLTLVKKLIGLRDSGQVALNVDCRGWSLYASYVSVRPTLTCCLDDRRNQGQLRLVSTPPRRLLRPR